MIQIKRILSSFIIGTILISNNVCIFANENNLSKEEIVYVMADNKGLIKDVYVVNVFEGGEVEDYGNYRDVKMLNTKDEINLVKDVVKFNSSVDKVYYQGTMLNKEIPWNICINYYIDDKEYDVDDIAGKSGKLRIKICISKNDNYEGTFYDDFTLQTTFSLDTEKFNNIVAEGATIVNVGKSKQILYTSFPGKGLDAEIFADVVNFEMESIKINGMKLNLNIDLDTTEMLSKIKDLKDGIYKVENSANNLKEGMYKLKVGGNEINDNIFKLNKGVTTLDNGLVQLNIRLDEMEEGLKKLNEKSSELVKGSSKMKDGTMILQDKILKVLDNTHDINNITETSIEIRKVIKGLSSSIYKIKENVGYMKYKEIMTENDIELDKLKNSNNNRIDSIDKQINFLRDNLRNKESNSFEESDIIEIKERIKEFEDIKDLIICNNKVISGTEKYFNSVEIGIESIINDLIELQNKHDKFDKTLEDLTVYFKGMIYDLSNSKNIVEEFVKQYSKLDSGINDYTNGIKSFMNGYKELRKGVLDISNGSKSLKLAIGDISNGSSTYKCGIDKFYDGVVKFNDGTENFYKRTYNIDSQIEDKMDEIIKSIKNEEAAIKSFTSDKNTNVRSLQFVIKTYSINKKKNIDKEIVEEKTLKFWDKILNLFIYNK